MLIPPRDFQILQSVVHYETLLRSQITRLHADLFSNTHPDRMTRKRLGVLTDLNLVNVTPMRTINPLVNGGVAAPVYYPSVKGCELLAQELEDDRYRRVNTTTPHHLYLYHFVAVAETHILLDQACKLRGDVTVAEWIGERSVVNPAETNPAKKYRLYTRFNDKLCCVPDAGFLLQKGDFKKVFYLEQDRDTTKSADRVAAQKCGGYAALAAQDVHRTRHFPAATWKNFNVLCLAPTPKRRDSLRKAVMKQPKGQMWKFASLADLTAASFLTAKIWYQGDDQNPSAIVAEEAS